jgi:CRP-like cAMP-binding protein
MGESAGTKALSGIAFFSDLSAEDLASVLAIGEPQSFDAGEAIVTEDEAGDGMYIVLEGRAQVDVGGRYHDLGPGDFFGEMALLAPRKRMATVKAVEPVQALKVPAEAFRALLLDHPELTVKILQTVIERLREVQERIDAWIGS